MEQRMHLLDKNIGSWCCFGQLLLPLRLVFSTTHSITMSGDDALLSGGAGAKLRLQRASQVIFVAAQFSGSETSTEEAPLLVVCWGAAGASEGTDAAESFAVLLSMFSSDDVMLCSLCFALN